MKFIPINSIDFECKCDYYLRQPQRTVVNHRNEQPIDRYRKSSAHAAMDESWYLGGHDKTCNIESSEPRCDFRWFWIKYSCAKYKIFYAI